MPTSRRTVRAGRSRPRVPARKRLEFVESVIDSNGQITIGRAGPVPCAAIACDEDQQIAVLVRRPKESLDSLLLRLDAAIAKACEDDEYIDEING